MPVSRPLVTACASERRKSAVIEPRPTRTSNALSSTPLVVPARHREDERRGGRIERHHDGRPALEVLDRGGLDVDVLALVFGLDGTADHEVLIDLGLAQRIHELNRQAAYLRGPGL